MQQNTAPIPEKTFLTDKALANRLDVSRATIWRWVRGGKFPAPVRLGENVTRWRVADVVEWENSLSAA